MTDKMTPDGELRRVAIYVRVSTDEQAKEHYSLETQETKCREKLDQLFGRDLYVAEVFRDEGLRGTWGLYDPGNPRKKHRPALTRMRDAFKDGRFDVICIYRISRIWRRSGLVEMLQEHYVPHGLREIISVCEHLDISNAGGRCQINMLSTFGAFESDQLGEWISDAHAARRKDGYVTGKLFGWRPQTKEEASEQKRVGITRVPEQADIIAEMARRYLAGNSVRSIAVWLNDTGIATSRGAAGWTVATVTMVLRNPIHAGLVPLKSDDGQVELIRGAHFDQRIFDPEVHHQLAGRLGHGNPRKPRLGRTPDYPLGGLATCAHCGYRLNGRRVDRLADRFYRCPAHLGTSEPECSRNSEKAFLVEGIILDELRKLAGEEKVQKQARSQVDQLLADEDRSARADLEVLERRRAKLWESYRFWSERYQQGRCPEEEFEFHLAEFREDKQAVEGRIKELQTAQQSRESREAVLLRAQEIVGDFDAAWEGLSADQRSEVLRSVLESVTVGRLPSGDTEVTFTIRGFATVRRLIGRRNVRTRGTHGPESLTSREQAFLLMVGEGMSRRDIMRKLSVSKGNVDSLLSRARRKLDAATDLEAWEKAREHVEANRHWLPLEGRARKQTPEAKGGPLLTEAQTALLSLLAQGMTVAAAAKTLDMKDSTPYVHLKNCRDRLSCASNEEAVRRAKELGLLG